ncbi:MAG: translation initiation factor IF-2 [Gammaproteobacteria bacterium]|nr:translation initiation factor IF-2 [Gammaproteobacteria bacterium]
MSTTTVSKLSLALKISSDKLIGQLKDAGIDVDNEDSVISNDQKLLLLNHLRGSHGTSKLTSSPKKLVVNRRSQSEIKLSGGFGTSRTVNVEVRKKRTYLNKDSLMEEAKKEALKEDLKTKELEQKRNAQEKLDKIKKEKEEQEKQTIEVSDNTLENNNQQPVIEETQKEHSSKGKNKKRKKTKHFEKDSFGMEELHVSGKIKKRKKRQVRRTLNITSLDQGQGFEKPSTPIIKEIKIPKFISPQEIAQKLSIKVGEVITVMMNQGIMSSGNDPLDQDTAILLVEEIGHKAIIMDERSTEDSLFDSQVNTNDLFERPPVVTIMGHVDHGKTSLLDYIRKTKVTESEAGGITQHIGAYSIDHNNKAITFLDTPGHAAFTQMRARGANVTDIVILVVAADDGVKPQTIEAIEHAKLANVPLIVAINKIDKPDADLEKVKSELLSNEIIPEELGGEYLFVNVSAISGEGVDTLLETILLQAEVLDLKAPNEGRSIGTVLESGIESGKGAVATILIREGKLNKGDLIIVGEEFGKARILINEENKDLESVVPSMPVKVYGLSAAPNSGDEMRVIDTERQAKDIAIQRKQNNRTNTLNEQQILKMKNFMENPNSGELKSIPIMIKADVHGSSEAIKDSLIKLSTEEIHIDIVSSGVGGINESDINLAEASDAFIIGFNVRADTTAKKSIKNSAVDIKYYSIIYETIDDISNMIKGLSAPVIKEEICGIAEVRDIFDSPKIGKIAGCLVLEGTVIKSNPIRVLRDNTVIFEGELESLRRFKDDVQEVKSGTECGIGVKNYNDVKAGDQIECFRNIEVKS